MDPSDNGVVSLNIVSSAPDVIDIEAVYVDGIHTDAEDTAYQFLTISDQIYFYVRQSSTGAAYPYDTPEKASTTITTALEAAKGTPGRIVYIRWDYDANQRSRYLEDHADYPSAAQGRRCPRYGVRRGSCVASSAAGTMDLTETGIST